MGRIWIDLPNVIGAKEVQFDKIESKRLDLMIFNIHICTIKIISGLSLLLLCPQAHRLVFYFGSIASSFEDFPSCFSHSPFPMEPITCCHPFCLTHFLPKF